MEICRASTCLIAPCSSSVRGAQDSATRPNGKSTSRRWETKAFYRLVIECCRPIRSAICCSRKSASSVENASRDQTGILIEKKHIISAALVTVEVKRLKSPTGSAISSSPDHRLKNRILSCDEPSSRTQHLSAGKSAAKESTLTDLPRCS